MAKTQVPLAAKVIEFLEKTKYDLGKIAGTSAFINESLGKVLYAIDDAIAEIHENDSNRELEIATKINEEITNYMKHGTNDKKTMRAYLMLTFEDNYPDYILMPIVDKCLGAIE